MKLINQLWIIIVISIIAGVLFLLDIRDNHPEWTTLYWIMVSLTCAQGVMTFGAAWFFLSGLKNFKPGLRKAYILLCIGVLAFGLSQAQLIPMAYLDIKWWVTNGFFTLPYMTSFIFFFLGVRQFAKVLGVKTKWTSWPLAALASFATAGVLVMIPHAPSPLASGQYATVVGFTTVVSVFFAFAAGAAFRLRREIGPLYTKALTWLAIGLSIGVIGGFHYVFVEMAVRIDWYYAGNLTVLFMFISSALTLYSGYAVREINEISSSYVPKRVSPDPLVFVEIVTYITNLVSRPTELDVALDDLRVVTSQLSPTQSKLESTQEQKVIKVYRKVEEYLVKKERLRIYTREDLRENITKKFKLTKQETNKLWAN